MPSARHQTQFESVNRSNPCPLCEGIDGCSIGADGLLLCRRREGSQPGFVCLGKAKGEPQWTVYRCEGDPLLNGQHKPPAHWQAKAEALAANLTPALRDELAGALGLPPAVLDELPLLGFCADGPHKEEGKPLGPCWTFPEVDGAGRVIGLTCRYRDGPKKAWPRGKRGLTVPARWRDRDGPIFLPEGPSDVLAVTTMQLSAIGRPSNMGGVEHLAELLRDVPADRQLVVLGELDANDKGQWPGREGALKTACELAEKLGRAVQWALPPDGAKDARAWVLSFRPEPTWDTEWSELSAEFLSLWKPLEAKPEKTLTPNEAPDDPHRLARLYIAERCEHPDGLTLRRWRELWHRWDGSAYRALPDAEMQGELTASAKREMDRLNLLTLERADRKGSPAVQKITRSMIGNVEMVLASLTGWPGTIEPPLWWDGQEWKRRNLIALSNGLLDLDVLFDGIGVDMAGVLLPHSPRWFSPACLPYPFDADADCPRWRAFLVRNLEGDAERIALLQEWFGYCVTADTSRQKFLVLEGEGSNGKNVVCAALEAMLGSENCAHVPLECFGARFQLEATLGKLANIASEVGEIDKAAEGFLKSFTSGDPMQFEQKYKPTFSAVPTARVTLATNNRPRFSDRSAGLWRRMILLPFRVVIAENDPGRVFGMDKPAWWDASGELPGILNWALAGLDRLRRQDRFTTSQVCKQALAEYRTENNPARMFLLEACREAPHAQTPCGGLYQAYSRWCGANGYSPLADRSFGKEVKRVYLKVERRDVQIMGRRMYVYVGLESLPG